MGFSLKKHEILRSKKSIQELFENGSSFFLYPFKTFYLPNTGETCTQVLFTVPKKYFKKAVDRNLVRRRMREAYRLNKNALNSAQNESLSLSIALIYISKSKLSFNEIDDKLKQVIVRLNKVQS
ncbi:MAG: ribonuclease P protein component [Cyclobacteriaceae bacterium]|nr:ribonuclease P protein component [Cyclobacteriaceae bacterium]